MAKMIKYRNQGEECTAEVIANKGICWQIAGGGFVPKKLVINTWEELEVEEDAPASQPGSFAAALAEITKPAETKPASAPRKASVAHTDEDIVTLKQLCFDLNLEPRIARRRLRKAQGQIGTGSRWEWAKDSEVLVGIKAILAAKPAADGAE